MKPVERNSLDGIADAVERDPSPEQTVVVNRSELDERTIVVDRSSDEGRTIIVDRSGATDGTVVIKRGARREQRMSVLGTLPSRGRRAQLTPAPSVRGAEATGPEAEAVLAPGPGAVSTYLPRAIPRPPAAPFPVSDGLAATRIEAGRLPSVARRSRRASILTITIAVIACVVSIAGLVGVVVLLVQG